TTRLREWSALLRRRLLLLLERPDLSKRRIVDHIRDRPTRVLICVGACGFAPTGGLHAELLSQQGDKDLRFLFPVTRKRLQAFQNFLAIGLPVRPDTLGLAAVVLNHVLGEAMNTASHRPAVAVNRRFL